MRPSAPTPGPYAPCQVCESAQDVRLLFAFPDHPVVRCGRCGFVYLDGPRAVAMHGEVDCFSDEGYLPHLDVDGIAEEQVGSLARVLAHAGAGADRLPPGRPVLDVGCARGHFLDRFRAATGRRDLIGVELSEEMTAWGRAHLGLDLRHAAIEHTGFGSGTFGLITMWDVLEHLPFPRRTLALLLDLLAPGGWLVVEVPSEVTVFRGLARLGYQWSGGRLSAPARTLYHPAHLSYFTAGSLRALAVSLGGRDVTHLTKESHVTRFGLARYRPALRLAIRGLTLLDRALGTEAKLLCAIRRARPDES